MKNKTVYEILRYALDNVSQTALESNTPINVVSINMRKTHLPLVIKNAINFELHIK